jgi:hypothetical protein
MFNIKEMVCFCSRADRSVDKDFDRICSCHFESGKKENGPSIFPWNIQKRFLFSSPEKKYEAFKYK